jgi:hypothetical protein
MKRQKAFSFVLLLIEVVCTLFVAGIIVPSLIRSDFATKEALAVGSLRIIKMAGITFSYTRQNVEFAILGGLVGTIAACVCTPRLGSREKNSRTKYQVLRLQADSHERAFH